MLSVTDNYQQACRSIAEQIEGRNLLSVSQALKVVREVASAYHLNTMPRNEHIMQYMHDNRCRRLLMVKPAKTASGVAVVAVMPKPYECPHGRCTYCPGGIEFNTPLSYTGTEPATKAAQKFNYDSYQQVRGKGNSRDPSKRTEIAPAANPPARAARAAADARAGLRAARGATRAARAPCRAPPPCPAPRSRRRSAPSCARRNPWRRRSRVRRSGSAATGSP